MKQNLLRQASANVSPSAASAPLTPSRSLQLFGLGATPVNEITEFVNAFQVNPHLAPAHPPPSSLLLQPTSASGLLNGQLSLPRPGKQGRKSTIGGGNPLTPGSTSSSSTVSVVASAPVVDVATGGAVSKSKEEGEYGSCSC